MKVKDALQRDGGGGFTTTSSITTLILSYPEMHVMCPSSNCKQAPQKLLQKSVQENPQIRPQICKIGQTLSLDITCHICDPAKL
jgi:hypothetical protein